MTLLTAEKNKTDKAFRIFVTRTSRFESQKNIFTYELIMFSANSHYHLPFTAYNIRWRFCLTAVY